MFLVNSRFSLVTATPTSSHRKGRSPAGVPLLPKLRGQFAEFLNHSSLELLSILYLTTCVGLGYGPCTNSLEAFLGSIGSQNSPQRLRITSQDTCGTDLPAPLPTGLHQVIHHLALLPSCVTPSLDYYTQGPTQPHHNNPERPKQCFWVVSTDDSPLGADTRVREYQPVVHRLRLSASP